MYPPPRSPGRGRSVPRRTPRTSSRHRIRLEAPAALKPLIHVLNVVTAPNGCASSSPYIDPWLKFTKAVAEERRAPKASDFGSVRASGITVVAGVLRAPRDPRRPARPPRLTGRFR